MKRAFRKVRTGVSHAGPHQHHDRHEHNPNCSYRCQGKILEALDDQMYVRVEHAHGRAKRWVGHDVPFSLEGAEVHDMTGNANGVLRPGDLVEIRTRLARKPNLAEGEPIPLHRIHVLEAAAPDQVRRAAQMRASKA